MNAKILLAPLLLLSFRAMAGKDDKIIKTKLEKVTVYLNGAEMTHSGSINLTEGTNVVLVKGVSSKVSREYSRTIQQWSKGIVARI
jgi:hypothetical protein